MKFKFSLKNKEVSLEADIEGLVEKNLEYKSQKPDKKTRYQIRREEKRKDEAIKYNQQMKYIYILLSIIVILIIFGVVATILGI